MSDTSENCNKVMARNKIITEEQTNPIEENDYEEGHKGLHADHIGEDPKSNEKQREEHNEIQPASEHANEDEKKEENVESDPEFEQENIDSNEAHDATTSSNKDYAKLFEKYQERFYKVYSVSQKLFQSEVDQRQTLSFYQRRNNALIDLLDKFESKEPEAHSSVEVLSDADKSRIENLISMNPRLQSLLTPLLLIDDPRQQLKNTHKINLLINEAIPDLINDDVNNLELNPQDIEPWVRRHYPNLVISKYKSLTISANKFKETIEPAPTSANKRKRKMSKDDDNDDSSQSKKPKK